MVTGSNILLLMQLSDSAFPVGGFAYSSGLESALKQGFLRTIQDIRDYLNTYANQLISFDFPFICSSHDCLFSEGAAPILTMQKVYQAMLLNPPLRKASCITGSNWMKIVRQLIAGESMKNLEELLTKNEVGYEFPVIFGLSTKACNFSLEQSLFLFFFISLRDQISAMIRLSITGPFMAHKELKVITDKFQKQIENYKPVPYTEAVKTGYLLDLVQLTHHRVYSKLFQN